MVFLGLVAILSTVINGVALMTYRIRRLNTCIVCCEHEQEQEKEDETEELDKVVVSVLEPFESEFEARRI